MYKIFAPQTIHCSKFFFNFYWFNFDCVFFILCNLAVFFLTIYFKHFDFIEWFNFSIEVLIFLFRLLVILFFIFKFTDKYLYITNFIVCIITFSSITSFFSKAFCKTSKISSLSSWFCSSIYMAKKRFSKIYINSKYYVFASIFINFYFYFVMLIKKRSIS